VQFLHQPRLLTVLHPSSACGAALPAVEGGWAPFGPNVSGRRGPRLAADRRRPLAPQIDLASARSHIESRVIHNDYAIAFAGRCFQIPRRDVAVGIKRRTSREELGRARSLRVRLRGPIPGDRRMRREASGIATGAA
jgi:hypothetical protein